MSTWALGLSVVLYAATAWDFAAKGDLAMAVAFMSYAVANIAFCVIALRAT